MIERIRIAAACLLTLALVTPLVAQEYTATILMEPRTKTVLQAENADTMLPVASMTKMMTLLLVLEAIDQGTVTLDTPVTTSARASQMGGSQVYLRHKEIFPVRDLIAATMVHSANDAALALAEAVGGSEEAFVQMMNEKANELGMKNSKFYTPHGLPDPTRPADSMSARDAAILGIELMKHPMMQELAKVEKMPFRDGAFTMYNPNHLLRDYPGATGIKTGYHGGAGFCVTGSAKRGELELVTVVMGSKQKRDNFRKAAALLTQGFNRYMFAEPVKKGQRQKQPVVVREGTIGTVPVVAGKSAQILTTRGDQNKFETEVIGSDVNAPISKGQQVGWIVVKKNGKPVVRVPAVADLDVERASWASRMWEKVWPF